MADGIWPQSQQKIHVPFGRQFSVAAPANGYLWTAPGRRASAVGSYGEFINNGEGGKPNWTRQASLQGHFDPVFRSFDLSYSDAKRADRFIGELKRFESEGDMPRLQIVRLPQRPHRGHRAHRVDAHRVWRTTTWHWAGALVEAVSRSKFRRARRSRFGR